MAEQSVLYSYMFTLAIVLLPILNSYEFPIRKVGFGEFWLIIIMVIGVKYIWSYFREIIKKNNFRLGIMSGYMRLHWPYAVFLLYSILISVAAYFFTPSYSIVEVVGRLSRQLLYGVVLIIYVPLFFKPMKAFNYYKIIVSVAVIYLILQVALRQFDYSLYPNFIPTDLLYTIKNSTDFRFHYNLNIMENFRPTSFFLEPAYYVQYAVPFIAMALFSEKRTISSWMMIILMILTVFITKSANGIVYLGIVIASYFVYRLYKFDNKFKYLYTIVIVLVFANIFAVLFYLDNNYVLSILGRFNEVGIGKGNTSGNIRILRGFLIFLAVSGVFKIFGYGFGNYSSFKEDYHIQTEMDRYVANTDYMSGFTQILTSGGVIGISLFLYSLYRYTNKTRAISIVLSVLIVVMMISSSFYANPVYLLLMSFLISYSTENDKIEMVEGA